MLGSLCKVRFQLRSETKILVFLGLSPLALYFMNMIDLDEPVLSKISLDGNITGNETITSNPGAFCVS